MTSVARVKWVPQQSKRENISPAKQLWRHMYRHSIAPRMPYRKHSADADLDDVDEIALVRFLGHVTTALVQIEKQQNHRHIICEAVRKCRLQEAPSTDDGRTEYSMTRHGACTKTQEAETCRRIFSLHNVHVDQFT